MHGIFVSIKKVLSLPDGCIGWCTSRAVSVHYSFHFHLFPLLLLFLTASQLLSLYHINASSKATFQVSAICVIQTPSDIFCCLDESMYQRNFLFNLGPRRAENNRSITVLLWDAWPSYIQRKLCCIEFFVSFSGPLKVTILYPCDHFWKTKPALTPVFSLHCRGDAEMLQALNSLTGVLSLAARAAAPSHTAETKGKSQPRATSSLLWLHQGSSVVMSLLPLGLESVSLIRTDTDIKNNHLCSVALTGHWICM